MRLRFPYYFYRPGEELHEEMITATGFLEYD
jgi:hypothetical protein